MKGNRISAGKIGAIVLYDVKGLGVQEFPKQLSILALKKVQREDICTTKPLEGPG